MLHTVNKSPFEKNTLETCLRLARPGGDILLLEDGVVAAAAGTAISDRLAAALQQHRVFVLVADLEARGIAPDELIAGVQLVDYEGFVELAVRNHRVHAWL